MLEKLVEKTTFADMFIIIITSLALVAFWRGAWGLLDLYLLPSNTELSLWVSVLFGLLVIFLIALYRKDRLKKVGDVLRK